MLTFNFEKIKQKNPTGYTWMMASNMLNELLSVICTNETDILFINYFARKTFGFSKLKEKLSTDDLQEHILIDVRNIYRAKSRLLKRNILIKLPGGYYCLNILGIVSLYRDIFSSYYCDTKRYNLDNICSLAKNKMNKEGVDIIYLMQANKEKRLKLQEVLKIGKIKRAEAKIKKRTAFMKKEITQISHVVAYANNKCEDFGVEYRKDVPLTRKEKGQVKNWLRDCNAAGIVPNEILDKVCEHWKDLNCYVRDKQGNELLSKVFSFTKFYAHRRAIEEELALGRVQEKYSIVYNQM